MVFEKNLHIHNAKIKQVQQWLTYALDKNNQVTLKSFKWKISIFMRRLVFYYFAAQPVAARLISSKSWPQNRSFEWAFGEKRQILLLQEYLVNIHLKRRTSIFLLLFERRWRILTCLNMNPKCPSLKILSCGALHILPFFSRKKNSPFWSKYPTLEKLTFMKSFWTWFEQWWRARRSNVFDNFDFFSVASSNIANLTPAIDTCCHSAWML